jgi:hypothetical protein
MEVEYNGEFSIDVSAEGIITRLRHGFCVALLINGDIAKGMVGLNYTVYRRTSFVGCLQYKSGAVGLTFSKDSEFALHDIRDVWEVANYIYEYYKGKI